MLLEVLSYAARYEGFLLNEIEARKEIERIIDQAFYTDQVEMFNWQTQK